MQIKTGYYIGIDVGTGSARACVIDHNGDIVGLASQDIGLWQPEQGYYEQSTSDIWRCICSVVRRALDEHDISPSLVYGIGFDATCSLCAFSTETDEPVSVTGPGFNTDRNVILWLDHRAAKETDIINATGHKVLRYVGGKMSLEMEVPKILWLKNNMPEETFAKCRFYDLVDALTHLATGGNARSFSSMVCKQGYLPKGVEGSVKGWQEDFLQEIGLADLVDRDFDRIGGVNCENGRHLNAGEFSGTLCEKAAIELGLRPGVAIGSGVIDAYAGWIGTVGAKVEMNQEWASNTSSDPVLDGRTEAFTRLAVVAGTSSCHIAMSPDPIFVPGVWGPYRDTIFPDCWMAEGGQSATGQLLKHVIETHPAFGQALASAESREMNIFEFLNSHLIELAAGRGLRCVADLARYFFFYGDLFGNRSPLADSNMTGSLVGLSSDTSIEGLAVHYYGTLEFIALQTKQIVETMNKSGHKISSIFMSGSQCQNGILVNLIASACNMPVVVPRYIHSAVCHGAAMLGVKAASADFEGTTVDLWEVIDAMSKPGEAFYPTKDEYERTLLAAKYQVFLDQCQRQREYRAIVDKTTNF
ncbi:FGGY-family carbohydrate kinase [Aspergillus ruber CBS 135680]|uniref:Pentulose kinase n=1 Tax=Aspergillus ruber (strain CBS 135680) TaxID=1388766 RepID=A0A017S0D9_ASPRC|nr:Pentulose kinase [Aspergillus ruber CBS 135680]EYE90059.1 Pentulose kinase [Aspergillus ruber CBS 135680]